MCDLFGSPQSREAKSQIERLKGYEGKMLEPTFDVGGAISNIEKWYANMFSGIATTTSEALAGAGVPIGQDRTAVMTSAIAPIAGEKFSRLTDVLKMASQDKQMGKQLLMSLLGQQGSLTQLLSADTGLGTALNIAKTLGDIVPMFFGLPPGLATMSEGFGKTAMGYKSKTGYGSYDFSGWKK